MHKPILPVIAGPTASGKTGCAIALCKRIHGEVVSADSMQIYKGMDILTAAPSISEQDGIEHHLIHCVDPSVAYSADNYRRDALAWIADIRRRGRCPVLCGGTGLYIDAVTRPLSFSARPGDEEMRKRLNEQAQTPEGRRMLHEELGRFDPESAERLHENDVRRVVRAIEIYRLTGISQSEHTRRDRMREGEHSEIIFALEWPRDALCSRIDRRVDAMIEAGLIEEVRSLMERSEQHPTALQAIGYKEIAAALRNEMTMEKAVYLMKRATRALARRQRTWFKRDPRVIWLEAQGQTADDLAERMRDEILQRFGTGALDTRPEGPAL